MAGRTRAVARRRIEAAAVEVSVPTAVTASVARYPGRGSRIYVPAQPWQQECYRHFGICGEARYAAVYFGHMLSKFRLGVGEPTDDGIKALPPSSPSGRVLEALFAGNENQTSMLAAIGKHLTIAGECYLVGREASGDFYTDRQDAAPGADIWEVVPVTEMNKAGEHWTISYGDGFKDVELAEDDVVIRIWIPNPAKRVEADSPFRSLLPILAEIEWLTQNIYSQITSRLTGGGIFFVPQEISFPPPLDSDGKPQQVANEAEGFTIKLGDAMVQAREAPGEPESQAPLVVTAPGEHLKNMQDNLVHFWSPMDENTLAMRKEAVIRFAVGMDMPPERILGMSANAGTGGGTSNGVSHWGAWQIDEDTVKMHAEPMADAVTLALTVGYLRPVTGNNHVVTSDSSMLRQRPDRSKESMELYDRGELSGAAMRRENRFDETDAMEEEERKLWLTKKIAGGSATPEQVAEAARLMGVDLGTVGSADEPAEGEPPAETREARPDPSLEEHPTRREPEAAGLLIASNALVIRALERAGNKMRRTQGPKPPNVPTHAMHTMVAANGSAAEFLDGAWSCAGLMLDGVTDDVEGTVEVLNDYCTDLMANQLPHSRERLERWMRSAP